MLSLTSAKLSTVSDTRISPQMSVSYMSSFVVLVSNQVVLSRHVLTTLSFSICLSVSVSGSACLISAVSIFVLFRFSSHTCLPTSVMFLPSFPTIPIPMQMKGNLESISDGVVSNFDSVQEDTVTVRTKVTLSHLTLFLKHEQ